MSLTVGALRFLQRQGLRCPEDVALVAFTHYPWCQVTAPPLTCVQQPVREIGEAAADLFLRALRGELPHSAPALVLPVSLIVRASCGCRPAGPATQAAAARFPATRRSR